MTTLEAQKRLKEAIEQREQAKQDRNNATTAEDREKFQKKVDAATEIRDAAMSDLEAAAKEKSKRTNDGQRTPKT